MRNTKRKPIVAVILLQIALVSGCSKPDKIDTFKSPVDGVFYSVETYYNHVPVSDSTYVYAHLERAGKAKKMLVLEGGDLTVNRIIWNNPTDVTLCINDGFTETFRSFVTLDDDGGSSITIHNHLQEHCDAR